MSGRVNMKKGSAILIVLGMLAFMVVSAVAFSAFMRGNRLPSSFLRQKLVSTHLVKAALAEAMDEIDDAIGSHPYPDVRSSGNSRSGGTSRNYWVNRIFFGDKDAAAQTFEDGWDDDTVSPLSLEALAYIPPPLINTVRYWSRCTPTAKWNSLDYDAGRYVYAAVNVSDYIDINRVRANALRDGSPSNRVSMAYLFRENGGNPATFDSFVKAAKTQGYKTRFVSLADYNLAVNNGSSGFESPFCDYFAEGDGFFDIENDGVKAQQFVTDSWYPAAATNLVLYLTEENYMKDVGQSLDDLQNRHDGNKLFTEMLNRMDVVSLAALYDYIDTDPVPVSLAAPTLERTPMITGISMKPFGVKPILKSSWVPNGEASQNSTPMRKTWKLQSLGDDPELQLSVCGVFPFKRDSGRSDATSYDVEVLVRFFFSSEGFDFSGTRTTAMEYLRPDNKNWSSLKGGSFTDVRPVVTVFGTGMASVQSNILKPEQTKVNFSVDDLSLKTGGEPDIFGINYTLNRNGQVTYAAFSPDGFVNPLMYFNDSGNVVSAAKLGEAGANLKLNYAIWVRIKNGNDTVDLVPAFAPDDTLYNSRPSLESSDYEDICGNTTPIMPLQGGTILTLNLETFKANLGASRESGSEEGIEDVGVGQDGSVLAAYCDDPRYNYAPEDWYAVSGENPDVDFNVWFDTAKSRCDGTEGRQGDIFQFVSDTGRLQSLGELQFLPYTAQFRPTPSPNSFDGAFYSSSKYDGARLSSRTGPNNLVNHNYAWKTHWSFGEYSDAKDNVKSNPYNWGILDGRGGAVVNPYSSSYELLKAATVDTPYDWTVAFDNAGGTLSDVDTYCFTPRNAKARISDDQIKEITKELKRCLTENQGSWDSDDTGQTPGGSQWSTYWSPGSSFFGVEGLSDVIHDVDRKFLYSYWKSCFGNRQQLFLVFVRAEPVTLGGSSAGRVPSQLGARAVALVWREPVSSISTPADGDTEPPHRMRILFYHQFD